jgi:hypothetical protein
MTVKNRVLIDNYSSQVIGCMPAASHFVICRYKVGARDQRVEIIDSFTT